MAQPQATPPTPPTPQLPGGNVVSAIDSMDLLKYPMLAQMVTAINQQGLNNVLGDLLMALQQNESATLATTIQSGYENASAQTLYGGLEAGMGAVQAGAAGWNVKSSIEQGNDMSTAYNERSNALAENTNKRNALKNSIIPARPANDLHNLSGHGINVEENNPQPPAVLKADEKTLDFDRDDIEAKFKTDKENVKINSTKSSSVSDIIRSGGQLLQLPIQAAQGHAQVASMQQAVSQSAYTAQDAVRQSANQTLQGILQVDVYAQNVASSRA